MKMTIRKKLLAGFLGVILLTLGLGLFALQRMSALNDNTSEVGNTVLPSIRYITNWRYRYTDMRVREMRRSLEKDEASRAKLDTAIEEHKKAISEAQRKYEQLINSTAERSLYEKIIAGYNEYLRMQEQIRTLLRQGKGAEAQTLLLGPSRDVFYQTGDLINEAVEMHATKSQQIVKQGAETYSAGWLWVVVILSAVLVLSTGIALWLSNSLSSRIATMAERVEQLRGICITNLGRAIEAMAAGDLKFEIVTSTQPLDINSQDELGDLATSVNGIIKQTQSTVAAFEKSRVTLLDLIIDDGGAALNAAANRDLTQRVTKTYQGEFDLMKSNINQVLNSLDEALGQVTTAAEQVAAASGQISDGSQSLASGTSEQASALEEVSSGLQEMASMASQNTGNAKEARSVADGARDVAERGAENMQKLSAAIEKIKQSSDATAKIVKTIDEIAFQTNLLALNAAVEAARAGDAGKGFAVVAEEVRNLAMRSAEAAKNTANLIEESVTNAGNGVSLNLQVATDLKNIHEQIRKVSEVMGEIAVASEQQNQAVEQINQAVEQVNTVTQQAAANSEESASAAEEMSGQAQELLSMVSSFRLTSVNGNVQRSLLKTRPATVAVAAGHGKKAEKPARAWTAKPAGNGNGKHPAANGQHLPGHLQTEKMIPFGDDHDTLAAF